MEKHVSLITDSFCYSGLKHCSACVLFWPPDQFDALFTVFRFSDLCLIRHDSQSMECAQRILYVDVTNTQGLRESSGLCKGQGACGIRRSGPADLSLGCEHTNGTHCFQQHCHQ